MDKYVYICAHLVLVKRTACEGVLFIPSSMFWELDTDLVASACTLTPAHWFPVLGGFLLWRPYMYNLFQQFNYFFVSFVVSDNSLPSLRAIQLSSRFGCF